MQAGRMRRRDAERACWPVGRWEARNYTGSEARHEALRCAAMPVPTGLGRRLTAQVIHATPNGLTLVPDCRSETAYEFRNSGTRDRLVLPTSFEFKHLAKAGAMARRLRPPKQRRWPHHGARIRRRDGA